MERRNFLGLGALFAIAPLVPKINILTETKEKEPKIVTNKVSELSSIEKDTDFVKLIITPDYKITITEKKKSTVFKGVGFFESKLVDWKLKVKEFGVAQNRTKIKIDGKKGYEIVTVYQKDDSEYYEDFIGERITSNPAIQKIFDTKTIIKCVKV